MFHSDFTWNQFWGFQKCKICHFCHFKGSEFCSCCTLQPSKSAKIHKNQNSEPLNVLQWQVFALLECTKLISRKIRVIGKSLNFLPVPSFPNSEFVFSSSGDAYLHLMLSHEQVAFVIKCSCKVKLDWLFVPTLTSTTTSSVFEGESLLRCCYGSLVSIILI